MTARPLTKEEKDRWQDWIDDAYDNQDDRGLHDSMSWLAYQTVELESALSAERAKVAKLREAAIGLRKWIGDLFTGCARENCACPMCEADKVLASTAPDAEPTQEVKP